MNILVIGCGFIGQTLVDAAKSIDAITKIYLFDRHTEKAEKLAATSEKSESINDISPCLPKVQLVVEAASHEALRDHAKTVLDTGTDLMILSIGALVDEEYRRGVQSAAKASGAQPEARRGPKHRAPANPRRRRRSERLWP